MGTLAGFAPAKACFKLSRWFSKRHKTDAFIKLGKLLSELHVPHKQYLTGVSDAFSASFTRIWPSFPRCYWTPNKACLLWATPASTYRVQSLEFPKIVYLSPLVTSSCSKFEALVADMSMTQWPLPIRDFPVSCSPAVLIMCLSILEYSVVFNGTRGVHVFVFSSVIAFAGNGSITAVISIRRLGCLIPSLPQPVKFPGWMMYGRACKHCIFRSCNIHFQCYALFQKFFHSCSRIFIISLYKECQNSV